MTESWQESEAAYHFHLGPFAGAFRIASAPLVHLAGELRAGPNPVFHKLFALEAVRFRDERGQWITFQPEVVETLVQQPYLLVSYAVEASVGMQITARIGLRPEAIEAEYRLLTVAPVEELRLQVGCGSAIPLTPVALPSTSAEVATESGVEGGAIVAARLASVPQLLVFADLGDRGTAALTAKGTHVIMDFFGRPLEKGVILVARLAIALADPQENPAALAARYERWRSQTEFL